jgi:REP element-mobilizing transposase RayT
MKNYNPDIETQKTKRKLPHWEQVGCTYFITFRLNDSIPKSKLIDWNQRREMWLRSIGVAPQTPSTLLHEKLTAAQKSYHSEHFTHYYHNLLDQGLGTCELRDPKNAQSVANALLFFDHLRYEMGDFIIMPNHVHLLVTPQQEWSLSVLLKTWKSFSAREINQNTQQHGKLWQTESYDHIIRNEQQLLRIQRYIKENSKNLHPHEYHYHQAK